MCSLLTTRAPQNTELNLTNIALYKDRDFELWSEVAKVGHCDPIPGDEVECNLGLGSSTFWSKFHCYLASTVDDVNDEATS